MQIRLSPRISYIPATDDPLSADVVIVRGLSYTWVFDVGADENTALEINLISGKKAVVLSHFHKDHVFNLDKIKYDRLYVSRFTFDHVNTGDIITNDFYENDGGVHIHIFPIPSSHAKGSLGLEVDNEFAFLGDATYSQFKGGSFVYNSQLLKDEIDILNNIDAKYFCESHHKVFARPKEEVIARLKDIYSKRKNGNALISV
ncbi:MAG: MBL fold metallo-hydrolase [Lachnospiraceae bacterium]|nr:MBL fold metallo-hydrolase [Lachnospiraceae bacterium]